jgi:hypothetical protein
MNLLIPADPTKLFDIDSLEAAQNTLGPSKTKKDEEIQDIDNRSVRTVSVTPEQGGNDEDLEEVEQRPGDEVENIKKRKGSPLEPSSRKKSTTPVTMLKTTLTPDEFNFLLATMNEAIEEITKKQEAKKETMYNRIEIKLQRVHQALQSSHIISSTSLPEGTKEEGNEPVQLCQIANMVEVCLQKVWEEIAHATQALNKKQKGIIEQHQAAQQEKDTLQEKFEEERVKIQKEKEQLLAKQIGIEKAVNKAFRSMTGLE